MSIKNLQGLGKLADEIIGEGLGVVTLDEFAWKAAEVREGQGRNWIQRRRLFGKEFRRAKSCAKSLGRL